jgi:hypothetical protein
MCVKCVCRLILVWYDDNVTKTYGVNLSFNANIVDSSDNIERSLCASYHKVINYINL